ncbi:MAG TPA: hypothetical protein VF774_11470 [Pseudoduganella sp.]|jgi:hypothetical protein
MTPIRALAGSRLTLPAFLLALLLVPLAAVAAPAVPAVPAAPAASATPASDFPTVARVEYVLECMSRHGGKQEHLYQCSCVIDRIGAQVAYDDYVTMSVALRYQTLEGPRGAEFRDPPAVKSMAAKYKAMQADAATACMLR